MGYVPKLQYRGRVHVDPRVSELLGDRFPEQGKEIDPDALHEIIAPYIEDLKAFGEKVKRYHELMGELDRQNGPVWRLSLREKDVKDLEDALARIWWRSLRIDKTDSLIQVFILDAMGEKR